MKTQSYYNLENEVKIKTEKLTHKSWRGDLSNKALDNIQFGDLNYIQSEVTNVKNKKEIKNGY